MSVGVGVPRDGVNITWEPGDYVGPVVIRATNMENGDVGVFKSENDGVAFATWPPGTYTDAIVVYQDEAVPVDPDAPRPDNTLPEVPRPVDPDYGIDIDAPRPDHELPGDQPIVDNTLPGIGDGALPRPEHPIVLPDPEDPHVEHHLVAVIDSGVITVTVE